MKLRKYVKVFKNKASAKKLLDRAEYQWQQLNLGDEYYPRMNLSFDDTQRHRRARWTVTYYLGKYKSTQKISETDLYGKNARDATTKFKKLMADNFKDYRITIKNVKLKTKHGKDFNLYTFRYVMKHIR